MKNVYSGRRFDIETVGLPCVMLEPTQDGEPQRRTNNIDDVYFNVDLFAFSTANYHDMDKTIVGDDDYKGILDINNDIRACLNTNYSLGGTVIDVRPDQTTFDQLETGKYPVRGLLMPLKILYRQERTL
jgi:hypothetical protein